MAEVVFKSAGDIVASALSGENCGRKAKCKRLAKSRPSSWNQIRLAMKLSELSADWRSVAGEPLASRSAPASCEETEERLVITVNVPDQAVLSSARFRKARLERALSSFFGSAVRVDFKVGPITPRLERNAPAKVYRRAPVVHGEQEIAEREKYFLDGGLSPELASAMARVMLSLEKLARR